jgi:hypothetical protein
MSAIYPPEYQQSPPQPPLSQAPAWNPPRRTLDDWRVYYPPTMQPPVASQATPRQLNATYHQQQGEHAAALAGMAVVIYAIVKFVVSLVIDAAKMVQAWNEAWKY